MKISIKGFITHKTAERYMDCFDRLGVNASTNKFAVSDGVSKSFFPGVWAELLVDFFINNEGRINLADIGSYRTIQKEWVSRVSEIVNKPEQKFFVRNFFIQGRPAAATFVGLNFFKEKDIQKWEALALGDSFLFFVPEESNNISDDFQNVTVLSSKRDFEFNNFPDFFDSRNLTNKGKIKQRKHDLKAGTFYLMTDALAEWFISEKQNAINEIAKWKTQELFEEGVQRLRKLNLQNDDSAILIIIVKEDQSLEFNYGDVLVTNFHDLLKEDERKLNQERDNNTVNKNEIKSGTEEKSETTKNADIGINLKGDSDELNVQGYQKPLISGLQLEKNPKKRKKDKQFWERQLDKLSKLFGSPKETSRQFEIPHENTNEKPLGTEKSNIKKQEKERSGENNESKLKPKTSTDEIINEDISIEYDKKVNSFEEDQIGQDEEQGNINVSEETDKNPDKKSLKDSDDNLSSITDKF
ncbi:MAG: hypothetical protein ACXVNM_07085 [Bacteroidia bacterium]